MASGARSILTPSAVSTSAAPVCEDSPRLPCLATGTPPPAITKAEAVDMLTLCELSPPVPTMSIAPSGASTVSIFSRMRGDGAGNFGNLLAAHAQRHQEGADLAWRRFARHDDVERVLRLPRRRGRSRSATLAIWGFSVLISVESQRLGDGRLVYANLVFALQPRDQLVEQIVRKAGGEALAGILGDGIGAGGRRFEHFRHLEQDAGVARRSGKQPPNRLRRRQKPR